ncbi:MAG: nucleotidyltransferase domain-containing protein [Deltaproteobacteria bacterium]|nr:nucleotidyltransferase domain-containing protein [Deltaproteobacteria bacterium]MBW1846371.1 nucleotidyltransferase domain-containing protein [Deltaproteobacteria bacterium]MBW2364236.1 nucleotidyltransferase domain-containing protein [Deltaproteobacteria bacterium]
MGKDDIISSLKKYKEVKGRQYPIKRIGIFGSVARGDIKIKNDLDIVVELAKQDLFDIIGIKHDLEEEFHCSVDIVSYRETMNQFLKSRIDSEAIYA